MTEKFRNRGRLITLAILGLALLMGILSSCSSNIYKVGQPVVTHVLAITQEGDTVNVPINQINPTQRYHVIGYNYYRPHTYGPFYRFGWAVRPYEQVTYPHWTQDFYNNNNLHYNAGNGTNINYNPYGFGKNTPSVNSNPGISTPPNPAKTNMKKIN
tara:strand:+ start:84 stop:554 length:471 start_codon:yes stop_codon:yes gene_type:complete